MCAIVILMNDTWEPLKTLRDLTNSTSNTHHFLFANKAQLPSHLCKIKFIYKHKRKTKQKRRYNHSFSFTICFLALILCIQFIFNANNGMVCYTYKGASARAASNRVHGTQKDREQIGACGMGWADETNKQTNSIRAPRERDTDLNAIKMFFNVKMNFKIFIFPRADNKIKMRNGTKVDRTRRPQGPWNGCRGRRRCLQFVCE